nr:uncharacterized protein LOC107440475 [Parasteatoda tepidariorum]
MDIKLLLFSEIVDIETGAAEIRRLSVPRWVENGTEHPVVLDCDYIYNENDLRLVVKWFFQDNSEPVYQWIPALNLKHTSGFLRNHLDLNFAVNTIDPYCKYRALRIVEPSIELSGKYTCVVTSLAGQDSKEQIMTVFGPRISEEMRTVTSPGNEKQLSVYLRMLACDCVIQNIAFSGTCTVSSHVPKEANIHSPVTLM